MSDDLIEIRPDNARFMAAILLPTGVGWLALGWGLRFVELPIDYAVVFKFTFSLGSLLILAGLSGFDGAISISNDQISQRRFFRTKSLRFSEIEELRYVARKQTASLIIRGSNIGIAMTGIGFDRPTILRARRAILERFPAVPHNSIPTDDSHRG